MKTGRSRIEIAASDEKFYNYCLWEYQPLTPPLGKFKAATLLYHSFAVGQADENAFRIVELVRESIGAGNTVWGVKLVDGSLKWEFYFYDYRRRDRERSISQLIKAIAPLAKCTVPINENPHYFMFSVDIDNGLLTGTRELDEIHLYVGNVGSNVSSGISYSLTAQGNRLENLYYFFDAVKHREDIIGKICCSAFIDSPKLEMDSILWPELAGCKTICLANKQQNDCIYYSGITVTQLLFAMTRLNYPAEIVSFIRDNSVKLDHLRYDFGIDYTLKNGRMIVVKSGYYGTF
jgi:hypothetical protein